MFILGAILHQIYFDGVLSPDNPITVDSFDSLESLACPSLGYKQPKLKSNPFIKFRPSTY